MRVFDKDVRAAHAAIAGCSDETFMKEWSLKNGDDTIMTMPKIAVVRTFVINHIIHHRGPAFGVPAFTQRVGPIDLRPFRRRRQHGLSCSLTCSQSRPLLLARTL